ncbi:MAG TPA: calcium-binding protein [Bauldia sp.]|nr:calcium-binding protein [Bauldia sp.]
MVKFVAKQPVDTTDLEEFELLVEPWNTDFPVRESDRFVATSGDLRVEVDGSGFRYAAKVPLPVGTVTRIEAYKHGDLDFKITKLRFDMDDLEGASGPEAVAFDIFSGDDILKGSSGDDTLAAGNGDDLLYGRDGDDILYGGKGGDALNGGTGFDTLDGGKSKDTYVFRDAPGSGLDEIVAFQTGEIIELSAEDFAGMSVGPLADDQFVRGTQAIDADDRIIYDPATGALFHDADGSGGEAQVQFAQMQKNLDNFSAGNILVV